MKREIQAFGFFILCNAQTHDPVENFQDDEADNAGIDHSCADAGCSPSKQSAPFRLKS